MDNIALVLLGITLFSGFMILRNAIVFKRRSEAIGHASENARVAIENGDYEWKKFYDQFDSAGTYDQMLWSFTKWSFKDFYPGFKEEMTCNQKKK